MSHRKSRGINRGEEKVWAPKFGPGCLNVTYQTGIRFTILRKRKERASTRRTFLSGEDTQLSVERRKGRKSAMVRNLVSGYRRRVEFGYIWASHFSFPALAKVLPLSIIKHELPARTAVSGPTGVLLLPHSFTPCYTTLSLSATCGPLLLHLLIKKRLRVCPYAHVCMYICTMSLSIIHICADPRHAFQYPKFQALRKVSFARINLPHRGLSGGFFFSRIPRLNPGRLPNGDRPRGEELLMLF
jgi:hypothetical protein